MFLYFQGHTYQVVETAMNWSKAEQHASSAGQIDYSAGYLAEITSKSENAAIFNYLKQESKSWDHHYTANDGGGTEYVWMGATDKAKEGHWIWSNGDKLNFTNWGFGGEPDNYNDQDAAAIGLGKWPAGSGGLGNAGQWNDIDVTNKLYSLVESDGLLGTAGNDTIKGGAGGEAIEGAKGNDTLIGNGGPDSINGGAGSDKLQGGQGGDVLVGGAGKDVFIYNHAADSTVKSSGRDSIEDFDRAQNDKIDLTGLEHDLKNSDRFTFVGDEAFSGNGPEIRYEHVKYGLMIYISTDNDKSAEMSIFAEDVTSFAKSDFLL